MLAFSFATFLLGAISVFGNPEISANAAVDSSKAVLQSLFTGCPSGTTTCGPDKCCPFPNAVCCEDGEHCCPSGYSCDLQHQQCIKISEGQSARSMAASRGMMLMAGQQYKTAPEKISDRSAGRGMMLMTGQQYKTATEKTCPGGSIQCPASSSCCLNDVGAWSCCSKPTKDMSARGLGDNCCYTFLGYACCLFALFPTCTFLGCI